MDDLDKCIKEWIKVHVAYRNERYTTYLKISQESNLAELLEKLDEEDKELYFSRTIKLQQCLDDIYVSGFKVVKW